MDFEFLNLHREILRRGIESKEKEWSYVGEDQLVWFIYFWLKRKRRGLELATLGKMNLKILLLCEFFFKRIKKQKYGWVFLSNSPKPTNRLDPRKYGKRVPENLVKESRTE